MLLAASVAGVEGASPSVAPSCHLDTSVPVLCTCRMCARPCTSFSSYSTEAGGAGGQGGMGGGCGNVVAKNWGGGGGEGGGEDVVARREGEIHLYGVHRYVQASKQY